MTTRVQSMVSFHFQEYRTCQLLEISHLKNNFGGHHAQRMYLIGICGQSHGSQHAPFGSENLVAMASPLHLSGSHP